VSPPCCPSFGLGQAWAAPLAARDQDRRFFLRMLAIPEREASGEPTANSLEFLLSEAIQTLEVPLLLPLSTGLFSGHSHTLCFPCRWPWLMRGTRRTPTTSS
jgi:hypothetical protein